MSSNFNKSELKDISLLLRRVFPKTYIRDVVSLLEKLDANAEKIGLTKEEITSLRFLAQDINDIATGSPRNR
jgi:hypothetical protein